MYLYVETMLAFILIVTMVILYRIQLFVKKQKCEHDFVLEFTDHQNRCWHYHCGYCNTTVYIGMDD